jgi:outer membrane protein
MPRMTPQALLVATVLAGAGLMALFAGAAVAQDRPAARVTVGLGASVGPNYFGSDDYDIGPWGTVRFDYVRLPGGLSWGSAQTIGVREGFGLRGSFRYVGSRKGSDNPELRGLDTVDATMELGFGIGYEARDWRAFTDVRYGIGGHDSFVFEAGADAIFRPMDSLIVNIGPRLDFGGGPFMRTYFGVTEQESLDSGLPEYRPSGGLTAVGMEIGAQYAFTDAWGIEGVATYDRLVEDAADSPITALGSPDQFGFRLGITRSISLGF